MKKAFAIFTAFAIMCSSYAATSPASVSFTTLPPVEVPVLNAKNIMLPVGNTGTTISLLDLAHISTKDFQTISGKKLGFFDKIGFKIAQKKLRDKLNDDGTVKADVAKKLAKKIAEGDGGFHLGGFALGFLLGLIGVLIAYLINDENKSSRVKWAWLGVLTGVVLGLIIGLLLI